MNAIKTNHNLDFEVADYPMQLVSDKVYLKFKVGTCEGLWCYDNGALQILAVENKCRGNGHFGDTMEWFEYSAKEKGVPLIILEVWNQPFKERLIEKFGFKELGKDHLIKEVWMKK